MTMQRFHPKTGKLIVLSDERRCAERLDASEEFDDGMVFSEKPLKTDEMFVVRINKRIASWSGSIEIGLVTSDPACLEIPKGAITLRHGTILITGTSVNINGKTVDDNYCEDLDSLLVGCTVGIMRDGDNAVHLYINREDQGVACVCDDEKIWAVVDLYGKCSSILIVTDPTCNTDSQVPDNNEQDFLSFSERLFQSRVPNFSVSSEAPQNVAEKCESPEVPLMFHTKCGSMIRLTDENKKAIRLHHNDEFNNGVVMTNRTIKNNELFEIRLNTLIHKWSGSIEMGITIHAPDLLEIPSTMTNLRSGTVMLSGCGIITNGKGTRKEYLDFHLDELKVGDCIGLMRTPAGTLHYYINGIDQGVAANHIPPHVYGVVDLYGMAVSVSIVASYSVFERNCRNRAIADRILLSARISQEHDPIEFHHSCGKHVSLIGNQTCKRNNPLQEFNHAVVLTSRPLHSGEIFTVKVEEVVNKWSGSLEIGLTSHNPTTLDFPATMTNIRSGTWILTATGVMYNGVTVVDDYGSNLDSVKVGSRLGVCRKPNGNLHFFINDIDQGLAASGLPENMYGIVDLYGQVSKVSIINLNKKFQFPMTISNCEACVQPRYNGPQDRTIKFSTLHGKNCFVTEDRCCAYRKNADISYDNSVVLCDQLLIGKLYEYKVDKLISHWTGTLEVGVTHYETLEKFPSSLVELKTHTWVWTGCTTLKNGEIVEHDSPYDMHQMKEGTKIGIMLDEGQKIHGYLDGVYIGVLFSCSDGPLYPIINLYGKCGQITILNERNHWQDKTRKLQIDGNPGNVKGYSVLKNRQCFFQECNETISLLNNNTVAKRHSASLFPILFSARSLKPQDFFEILVVDMRTQYTGSLSIGLASINNLNMRQVADEVSCVKDMEQLPSMCLLTADAIHYKEGKQNHFSCPNLKYLHTGDKVGIKFDDKKLVHLLINGFEVENCTLPSSASESLHVVLKMGPPIYEVEVSNYADNLKETQHPPSLSESNCSLDRLEIRSQSGISVVHTGPYTLSRELCGKNIRVSEDGHTATRVGSYNQAMVITEDCLSINKIFQVKIKGIDEKWKSSISIGTTALTPSEIKFPVGCLKMTKLTWIIHGNSVYSNGMKIMENYCFDLNRLQASQVIGLLVDDERNLHLFIDGFDQGAAVSNIPECCYGIVEVYGNCEEIEVLKDDVSSSSIEEQEFEKSDYFTKNYPLSYSVSLIKSDMTCTKMLQCRNFLDTLSLPKHFFTASCCCYCNSCFRIRGESLHGYQGLPALRYTQPLGWCQFTLRVHPNVDLDMISKSWNVAYYGTKVGVVRKILDIGEVPFESVSFTDLRNYDKDDGNPQTKRKSQVMISPLVDYVANDKISPGVKFHDVANGKHFLVQLAFQLFVQPSSFKVRSSDRCHSADADPIEWTLKQRGGTIFSHLLVKVYDRID